jgi:hypothetical protein
MKLKISFDKKSIGKFFFEHSEKVVFGLFIILFATIMYGAVMRREKFDKVPKDLTDKCLIAQKAMQGEHGGEPPIVPKYTELANIFSNGKDLDVQNYECDVVWDRPPFGQKSKRGQPDIYDVQDLRAAADFGAFSVNAALAAGAPAAAARQAPVGRGGPQPAGRNVVAAPGSTRAKCWVVLTGLVPNQKQILAYKKVFRDAVGYNSDKDLPVYSGYIVERAEINNPDDLKKPDWSKPIYSTTEIEKTTREWASTSLDVVDNKYVNPNLTFPLGPLVNRKWGAQVTHPQIPLLNAGGTAADAPDAQPGAAEPPPGSPFDRRTELPVPGATARQPAGLGRGAPNPREGRVELVASANLDTEFQLFRFFDFSVKPGQSYLYRVRLVLDNPNYEQDTGKLIKPDLAKKQFLETAGTTLSKAVLVPLDTQVLAQSVAPRTSGAISAKILLVKWQKDTGQQVSKEFSVERGQVLNFKADSSTDNVEYNSGATVLDMDGGKKLPGRDRSLMEPGEMLLMFVRGNSVALIDRNELDDLSAVNQLTHEPEPAVDPGRSPRTPPPGRGRTEAEGRLFDGGEAPPGRTQPPPRTR